MDQKGESQHRLWLVIALGVLGGLAWLNRFIQDDALISFRYAKHLADGHGLVYNPGDRVEGYTNFLWTVVMAIPHAVGVEPILFSFVVGIACFLMTLWMVWSLGGRLFADQRVGLLAMVLLGTNYSFSSYATGGLETSFLTMLLTWTVWLAVWLVGPGGKITIPRLFGLSVVSAAAVLTRMDAGLFVATVCFFVMYRCWLGSPGMGQRLAQLGAIVLPGTLLVGSWLVWKWSFYGDILPNTYYVKATGSTANLLMRGTYYIAACALSYFLWPFALWWLIFAKRFSRELGCTAWFVALLPLLVGCFYIVKVGGDFMEFRFLVPLMPMFFLLVGVTLVRWVGRAGVRYGVVAALLVFSLLHGLFYPRSPLLRAMESIPDLAEHVEDPEVGWILVGKTLAEAFDRPEEVRIAVSPAGAIPYYSGCETIDMLGLNDPWVARNGLHLSSRAGHTKIAPLAYFVERDVNLFIGHCRPPVDAAIKRGFYRPSDLGKMYIVFDAWPDPESLPDSAQVVEITMPSGGAFVSVYLTPHPQIDQAIDKLGWRVLPLRLD